MKILFHKTKILFLSLFFSLNSSKLYVPQNLGLCFALKESAFGFRFTNFNLSSKYRFAQRILKKESNLLKKNYSDRELSFQAKNLYLKIASDDSNSIKFFLKLLLYDLTDLQLRRLLGTIANFCYQEKESINFDLSSVDKGIYGHAYVLYKKVRLNNIEGTHLYLKQLLNLFLDKEFKILLQVFCQISANAVR